MAPGKAAVIIRGDLQRVRELQRARLQTQPRCSPSFGAIWKFFKTTFGYRVLITYLTFNTVPAWLWERHHSASAVNTNRSKQLLNGPSQSQTTLPPPTITSALFQSLHTCFTTSQQLPDEQQLADEQQSCSYMCCEDNSSAFDVYSHVFMCCWRGVQQGQ